MALEPESERRATLLSAPYFTNKTVAESISLAGQEGYYAKEFELLNSVIKTTNNILRAKEERNLRDEDLQSVYEKRYGFSELPEMFSWSSRKERQLWTRSLLQTFKTLNNDIGVFYTDPTGREDMTPQDVFRWFLLDGYARWYAGMATNHRPKKLKEERKRADIVVFAFCEAAVLSAESGDENMRELVEWMLKFNWINTGKQYNLTPELVARAHAIVETHN